MSSTSNPRVQLIDSQGDPMDSAADNALKVKLVDTDVSITVDASELSVHLEAANDDVLIYGYDYSSANQKLKVDSTGSIYVKSITDPIIVNGSSSSVTEYAQFDVDSASAIQLSSADGIDVSTTQCREVIIQCDFDNTGYVMVGGSTDVGCDSRGIRLEAGDTLTLSIQDIADVYLIGSANDQMVNVMVLK